MRPVPARRWLWVLFAGTLAIVAFAWPRPSWAAGAKAVAVLIEGGDSDAVAAELTKQLPSELRVIDDKTFAEALRKAGHSGQFGNAIAVKGALRDKMLARAVKAIESTGADAAILGRVRIGKLGKEVWLVWLAANGDVTVDQSVSLRGSADEQRTGLRAAISGPASALLPAAEPSGVTPPPSEPPRDLPDPEPAPSASARTKHLHATELFEVAASFELGGRHIAFTDPISQNIRPYDVLGVPMIAVSGAVYPAAGTSIPVLKNIGITGRFAAALGLTSSTKSGKEALDTTWLRFRAGLRWRFVPGTEHGPVLALTGDYGMDTFTFANAGPLAGSVPSVEYSYLRAGGELRLPLGRLFAIDVGGGYRGLLGVGETGDRFSKGTALAFDASFGVAGVCPAGFEIRLSGDYTRVFYAFSPTPGDEYVAGGAVDEMLGARIGLAYVH